MTSHPKHRKQDRLRSRRSLTAVGALAALAVGAGTVPVTGVLDGTSPTSASPAREAAAPQPVAETPQIDVEQAVEVAQAKRSEPLPDLSKMSMAQLQAYSAKMQAEFVEASLAYEAAKTQAEQSEVAAEKAEDRAVEAEQVAVEARDEFGQFISDTYASGITADPMVKVLAGGPDSIGEFVENVNTVEQATTAQAMTVEEFTAISEDAEAAAAEAEELRTEAEEAEADAEVLLDDIQGRASKVATAANKALLDASDGRTLFASAEQQARNEAALKNWRAYLDLLDRAKVVPPAAASLTNPRDLPFGLKPLVGANGKPLPGVAAKKFKRETITVLSRETIAAVSKAFAEIGKPYVAGNTGPETYGCAGLTSAVWNTRYRLPSAAPVDQFKVTRTVPVANAQVGDLVYFTAEDDGVQHVGLNLGGDLMLTADAISQQVGVQMFPSKPYAVGRATLPRVRNDAPASPADSVYRCGGEETPASNAGMRYPLKDGTYTLSAYFGKAGSLWSSGYHTGQDFSAPAGTPVLAAKEGTVTVESNSWAGPNYVIIDHGNGLVTTYAHMQTTVVKTGDTVRSGQLIGAVGSLGNSTGAHLHFEVEVSGVKVDPMLFLDGNGLSGAQGWGGFTNGMIPEANMCELNGSGGQMLRCDAAAAWNAMAASYKKALGSPLCITDSYRSYAAQVTLYGQKPTLAAVPGTSNHGWALAVDLCGGIENFGTKQHTWMKNNAPKFGWIHPDWARQGGGREEPWHWEFGNIS